MGGGSIRDYLAVFNLLYILVVQGLSVSQGVPNLLSVGSTQHIVQIHLLVGPTSDEIVIFSDLKHRGTV